MTRDHREKKAVRAHAAATGRSYADAATDLNGSRAGSPRLAAQLRDELVAAFTAAGWPVVVEHSPQNLGLTVYPGPAVVHVGRREDPMVSTGDEHPDDPDVFDLDGPLEVAVSAPLIVDYSEDLDRVVGIDHQVIAPVTRPASALVADVDRALARGRARELAATAATAECGICGERFPAEGLTQTSRSPVAACPCCAFDGDLLGSPLPDALAFYLDTSASNNLAVPAGWGGVQSLLCCLGGPGLPARLTASWRAAGTQYSPREWWASSSLTWIWLPPRDRRPTALAGLGCGASLAHISEAIDRAHPDLRAVCRARREQQIDEYLTDYYGLDVDDDDPEVQADRIDMRTPESTFERLWPAVVGYAVAMLTQHAERPTLRDPWHVLESFELSDWVRALSPDLDDRHVESVLEIGIRVVRHALDSNGNDPHDVAWW